MPTAAAKGQKYLDVRIIAILALNIASLTCLLRCENQTPACAKCFKSGQGTFRSHWSRWISLVHWQ